MLKKISFLVLFLTTSCSFESKPLKKSSDQDFYDQYLLFDMESEVEKHFCNIQGKIPSWLSGTLLRNGPAKFQVGDRRVGWFDGLSMLHAFSFDSGQIIYANRFLRSEQYYKMVVEKSLDFPGFSQDPSSRIFKNQTSLLIPKEMQHIKNADVSIQRYADEMVALTEIPFPVVFDPKTLSTLGEFQYGDHLEQGQWESAHPQYDGFSKETINYFVRFGRKSSYIVWKMEEGEKTRKVIAEIPVEHPAYMHSFALTEHYVVLVEFPFVVDPFDLLIGKKPFIFNYRWEPERGTVFHVINRFSGNAFQVKGLPFFAFHHVNAFDLDGEIVMDVVTYPNVDIIKEVTEELKIGNTKTRLERFKINLETKDLSQEILSNKEFELPRVSDKLRGCKYQYCYAVDTRFPVSLEESLPLYKVDTVAKTEKNWFEKGCFPGEPIFVPNPEGQKEDEGVVLSLVLDFAKHTSFLLVLDAEDFSEIARAEVPHAVPVGLHGFWERR